MAEWKKVIVSGSDAELREVNTSSHITASGIISASGKLYGNLNENSDQTYVVVYNPTTGELEYKLLNLINATRAPELYLIDHDNDSDDVSPNFRFSFDSSSNTGNPITAPIVLSASIGGAYDHAISTNDSTFASEISINSQWNPTAITQDTYFNPDTATNDTASQAEGYASGPGNGRFVLNLGNVSQKEAITLHLQSVDESNTATPSPNGTPYQAKGFDSPAPGDSGEIRVYVNTMELDSPTATFDIGPSVGEVTTVDSNITPNISVSSSNIDGGEIDTLKCNRTGTITIGTAAQVDGFNYAFLLYTGSRGDNQVRALTNFTEWFYDEDGAGHAMGDTDIPDSDVSFTGLDSNDYQVISGIRYFNETAADSAVLQYIVTQSNQYRNIYPISTDTGLTINFNDNCITSLTVKQSGDHLSTNPTTTTEGTSTGQTVPLASLATSTTAHLSKTNVTCSFGVDFDDATFHHPSTFLEGASRPWGTLSNNLDLTCGVEFHHPNKAHKTRNAGTIDSFLVNDLQPADATNEYNLELFRSESYRIISRSYSDGDTNDPDNALYTWDGTKNIVNGGSGHNNGNLIYHSYLCYPKYAGLSSAPGKYSSSFGPVQVNDYSSGGTEATGVREYFRYFKLISGQNGAKDFNLEFKGKGRIVHNTSTLFASNTEYFRLEVMRTDGALNPGTSTNLGDLIDPLDDDVRLIGNSIEASANTRYIPLTNNASQINYSAVNSIGGVAIENSVVKFSDKAASSSTSIGEHIVVRIITPQGWTGYIDAMALTVSSAPTPILPNDSIF